MSAGALAGIPVHMVLSRVVRAQLYGVSPEDPGAIVLAAALLTIAAGAATLLPACRAVRVDPVEALRHE